MSDEPESRTIEVRCVGRPPAERVSRASGVSHVQVEGSVLRCWVTGSVQPFLEALHGAEILNLATTAGNRPASTGAQPPAESLGRPDRRTTPMRTYLINARVAGVLFIAATALSLIDSSLIRPLLAAPDYLTAISLAPGRITVGAFVQVLAGLSSVGIAIALYPVLRQHSEALSLGAVALRTVEGFMYMLSALGALLLVALSQRPDHSTAFLTGDLLISLRDNASLIGVIAFYIGGSLYYTAMARSRVVPRWLSWWGLASTTLGLVAALAVFSGALTLFSPIQIAFNLPIFLNELVLAGWLLIKGFTITATTTPQGTPLPTTTASL